MTIKELQNWVAEDWKYRSKRTPSVELQILYIIEELGEVAEAIRKNSGNKNRASFQADIGSEIADLIISITTLANYHEIDIENEINQFKKRLSARHNEEQ